MPYLLTVVYSKFYGACPKVFGFKNNMARSVRSKDRASKDNRKYKPGVKLYQVERLVSKRKSSNKVSHIILIIVQSCKQWTADFMTSVFACTL